MYTSNSKRSCILIIACLLLAAPLISQAPFSRGVNLTSWFQVNSPGEIQFTRFTRKDLADIKSLGFDVIRLPINMHAMTSGNPSYTLDPLYFSFLDSVVTWCEQLHLYLILDNHSFDPNVNTSPDIAIILTKVWSQMALHYRNRSDYLLYEILNEPHGITTSAWGAIQNQAINAIRAADTKHTIVVGGSGYNTYTELANLPTYTDANLLYTFHFYDPFVFTHQGASWTDPSMVPLAGVPFPYNSSEMPSCPASLKGTWIESSLNSYPANGNVNKVRQLIDYAVNFRSSRGVNVFCGEFGVYIPNSDNADRCYWYKVVSDYLEEKNIPWTMWDYKGGFGLFKKGTDEFFEHDLNTVLLDSLGLNIPLQTPFSIKPDSTGFMIYTDYIGEKTENSSYSTGIINFYSGNLPSNDHYCLSWDGFSQYNALGFDFVPDKDLTRLVPGNYALDFMVRGSEPGIKFEIRFKDSKTGAGDHPWRIGTTIDAADAAWDRKWHHVRIPLLSFTERGAWDDGTWYNPEGKYDWSKVDKLEISTEWTDIIGRKVWFDNIHISDVDTAIVRVDEALWIRELPGYELKIKIVPNPVRDHAGISFIIPSESHIIINIFSLTGTKIRTIADCDQSPGLLSFDWDCRSDNGSVVQPGLYICQIIAAGFTATDILVKL
jgi:endoglucanase